MAPGFGERLEHGRVVAGAVERLLHGYDGRILRALLNELDHRIVGIVGVVKQNVAMAQLVEDAGGLAAEQERLGREGLELEIGTLDVAVKKHEAGKIHGTFAAEDLILVELEVHAQPLHNLGIGVAFDLQAHGVALATIVQLDADGFEQRARLFFFEVEVGVARDAERRGGQHLVAAIHAREMLLDKVLQQEVVVMPVVRGQADKAWQGARHSDHAKNLRA